MIPFIQKQSLKSIGDGIDSLCEQLVTNQGDKLDEAGQDISQIAFFSPSCYIEDVRLLSTYSQKDQNIDKMVNECFTLRQQIIYEDDLLDKVVVLIPVTNMANTRSVNNCLVLRFVLQRDDLVQKKVDNIRS